MSHPRSSDVIRLTESVSAPNYTPLDVVITRAEDVWAWDLEGQRYLDCISAYSSLNQGHRHPRIIAALTEQAGRLTLTSRAVHNDRMGPFLAKLCDVAGFAMALPMNTGAEAVETAIKLARKWGYRTRGIAADTAEIIVCDNNFHGRTTTIVGFSSEPAYRQDFGPFTPGFRTIPFGDPYALEQAITPCTAAFLVEPIQAEAGIIMPPADYLSEVRRLCSKHGVLLMLDEIQTGLGRTGRMFAWQHEPAAKPDVLILGKALGGGVYPVSAVLADKDILALLTPGTHGSTFGGNALAAAVGEAALAVLVDEQLSAHAERVGALLRAGLDGLPSRVVRDVRGRGLLIGIEVERRAGTGREYCQALLRRGVLAKDTHAQVIRIAPPLTLKDADLRWLLARLHETFNA